jgi:hypothetical protein
MAITAFTEDLARIAHALWRRRMEAAGWRSGGTYDPQAHIHDALVPFEQLGRPDQRATLQAVAMLGLEEELALAVEYERGPGREFTLAEMQPGLEVTWAEGTVFDDPARALAGERGAIESWEGCGEDLKLVRIRWKDGTLSEHFPSERELQRLGW